MSKIILTLSFCFYCINTFSQNKVIPYPRLSPYQKTEIRIGVCDLKLEYCRPSTRNRKIFGELVPFGKMWRTGANKNSKLSLSEKLIIAGNEIKAGTYSIFTKPGEDEWEVYFYTELDKYGIPEVIDNEKVSAKFKVNPIKLNRKIESLSMEFENLKSNSVDLVISWERVRIEIPITIPTNDIISEKLKKEWELLSDDYTTAAVIYLENEKDYDAALESINTSISILENGVSFEEYLKIADTKDRHIPYKYLIKSEIHASRNEINQAVRAAEKSLKLARLVKDKYYINRNEENLMNWEN